MAPIYAHENAWFRTGLYQRCSAGRSILEQTKLSKVLTNKFLHWICVMERASTEPKRLRNAVNAKSVLLQRWQRYLRNDCTALMRQSWQTETAEIGEREVFLVWINHLADLVELYQLEKGRQQTVASLSEIFRYQR